MSDVTGGVSSRNSPKKEQLTSGCSWLRWTSVLKLPIIIIIYLFFLSGLPFIWLCRWWYLFGSRDETNFLMSVQSPLDWNG